MRRNWLRTERFCWKAIEEATNFKRQQKILLRKKLNFELNEEEAGAAREEREELFFSTEFQGMFQHFIEAQKKFEDHSISRGWLAGSNHEKNNENKPSQQPGFVCFYKIRALGQSLANPYIQTKSEIGYFFSALKSRLFWEKTNKLFHRRRQFANFSSENDFAIIPTPISTHETLFIMQNYGAFCA